MYKSYFVYDMYNMTSWRESRGRILIVDHLKFVSRGILEWSLCGIRFVFFQLSCVIYVTLYLHDSIGWLWNWTQIWVPEIEKNFK